MDLPKNKFKKALKAGTHQIGIWNSIAGNSVPELLATCGFDWVLIDTGDIVVHIFKPEIREFYQLEQMWNSPQSERS